MQHAEKKERSYSRPAETLFMYSSQQNGGCHRSWIYGDFSLIIQTHFRRLLKKKSMEYVLYRPFTVYKKSRSLKEPTLMSITNNAPSCSSLSEYCKGHIIWWLWSYRRLLPYAGMIQIRCKGSGISCDSVSVRTIRTPPVTLTSCSIHKPPFIFNEADPAGPSITE